MLRRQRNDEPPGVLMTRAGTPMPASRNACRRLGAQPSGTTRCVIQRLRLKAKTLRAPHAALTPNRAEGR